MKKNFDIIMVITAILVVLFQLTYCSAPAANRIPDSFIGKNIEAIVKTGDIDPDIFDSNSEDTVNVTRAFGHIYWIVEYDLNNSKDWLSVLFKDGEPIVAEWHCPQSDEMIEEAVYSDFPLTNQTESAISNAKLRELRIATVQLCEHPYFNVGVHTKANGEKSMYFVFNKQAMPW